MAGLNDCPARRAGSSIRLAASLIKKSAKASRRSDSQRALSLSVDWAGAGGIAGLRALISTEEVAVVLPASTPPQPLRRP
ncbi:hypothetical protein PspLS_06840 [Pyricularia sp. CBS 133598]|nr:hypothetical protein PspLS_06840 [Pyricularia sp. CBS 133598]